MAESPQDKEILARLEAELERKDARLAAALGAGPAQRLRYSPALRTWLGLTTLLVIGLIGLVVLGILVFDLGPVGLGLLTTSIAVPWLLLAYSRVRSQDRGPTSAIRQ